MSYQDVLKSYIRLSIRSNSNLLVYGGFATFFVVSIAVFYFESHYRSKLTEEQSGKLYESQAQTVRVEPSVIERVAKGLSSEQVPRSKSTSNSSASQSAGLTAIPDIPLTDPRGQTNRSRVERNADQPRAAVETADTYNRIEATKVEQPLPAVTDRSIVESAKDQQSVLIQRFKESDGKVSALKKGLGDFQANMILLHSNDEGRKIAADKRILEKWIVLFETFPELKESTDRLEDDLSLLKRDLIESTSTKDYIPLRENIAKFSAKSNAVEKQFSGFFNAANKLVELASVGPVGESTLKDAIEQHSYEQKMQLASQAESIRKAARERIAEADRNAVESETQRQLSERNAKIAADRIQIEKNEFEKEFLQDLREIESLLAPFITPATNKFYSERRGSYLFYPSSPVKQPFSLKSLQVVGALESTPDGFAQILTITTSSNLLRPLGSFPNIGGTEWRQNPEAKRKIERAQFLLQKYGSLLVEKALLEP